jgi:hypothetical protein
MRSVEWLSGLLEGEGCFSDMISGTSGLYTTPLISLVMTDHDVIEEAAKVIFEVGGRETKIRKRLLPSGKTAYLIYLTGLPAAKVMHSVLNHMGARRTVKIKSILAAWNPKKYKEAVVFKTIIEGY